MKDNKYEKILRTASKLLSKRGVNGTSFQMIADKVGLHKSTLFHYFENKEELILRILEKTVDEVDNNLEKIVNDSRLEPERKLEKAINNHVTLLVESFDTVNVYLSDFRSLSKKNQAIYLKKRRKYQTDFEKIIREMKAKRYFNGLNSKIVTFGLLGMLNWVTKWYKKGGPLGASQVGKVFYEMVSSKNNSQAKRRVPTIDIHHGIDRNKGRYSRQ